jgi:hypothetical protein
MRLMATNPVDPIEEDIAETLADPEFRASLKEDIAGEDRGELEPGYTAAQLRLVDC